MVVLRLWRLQAALVMTLAATPGEPTSTNYFNWKKGPSSFTGLLQNTADGIVTCNWYFLLCCWVFCFLVFFLDEMTYLTFFAWTYTRKSKGISYGSPVLLQVLSLGCDETSGLP